MINNTRSLKTSANFLVLTGIVVASVVAMSFPVFAYAATYAYVNTTGEVRTVTADNSNAALATAPGLHTHSGVMLLTNPADGIVGDQVGGI